MIDIAIHRSILLGILKDIYQDTIVSPWLGFKGGTALYFFHGLNRFSVDLDFDLLIDEKDFDPKKIEEILKKYMTIKDHSLKRHTFFYLGSYRKTHRNVKVEISRERGFHNEYETEDLYGISVKTLAKPYLFAHKLCAIRGRKILASRDLFDAHFMFEKHFPLAEEIIEVRTGLSVRKYFDELVDYIPNHLPKSGVLHGLGELLDEETKQWAKAKLVKELLFFLRSYQ